MSTSVVVENSPVSASTPVGDLIPLRSAVVDNLQLAAVDAASPEARWAMTQYFAELDARFPEGFDATGALDDAATAYNPPLGLFILATETARPSAAAGCR